MADTSDVENFPAQVKISVITLGQICRYEMLGYVCTCGSVEQIGIQE